MGKQIGSFGEVAGVNVVHRGSTGFYDTIEPCDRGVVRVLYLHHQEFLWPLKKLQGAYRGIGEFPTVACLDKTRRCAGRMARTTKNLHGSHIDRRS
jgi:hypothetical protein